MQHFPDASPSEKGVPWIGVTGILAKAKKCPRLYVNALEFGFVYVNFLRMCFLQVSLLETDEPGGPDTAQFLDQDQSQVRDAIILEGV